MKTLTNITRGIILSLLVLEVKSFTIGKPSNVLVLEKSSFSIPSTKPAVLMLAVDNKNDGVVELVDDEEETTSPSTTNAAAPSMFLSQGEIDKEVLELTNDPKQTRVIIYIIISLIPVLFLIPLMLGSRDLIPLDALPPVDM